MNIRIFVGVALKFEVIEFFVCIELSVFFKFAHWCQIDFVKIILTMRNSPQMASSRELTSKVAHFGYSPQNSLSTYLSGKHFVENTFITLKNI